MFLTCTFPAKCLALLDIYRERLMLSMVGWVAPLVCEVDRNDRSLVEPWLIHCEMSVILICTNTIDTLYIECYALTVCNIAHVDSVNAQYTALHNLEHCYTLLVHNNSVYKCMSTSI